MELQEFINDNEDYIMKLKEHKLNVKKYTRLGLVLVKTYSKNEYDYKNNPWMRYCRGAIIDMKTRRLVCIPPTKSEKIDNFQLSDYGEEYIFEPLIDGTMINMFYHNNSWVISTRSSIGAKNSWDGNVCFCDLFEEINGTEWYDSLNKFNCYSFVLQHKKNRIVSQLIENQIILVEEYNLKDDIIQRLTVDEFDTIEGISNNIPMVKENTVHYFDPTLNFSIKGFTIKNGSQRVKWINPNYEYVSGLKANFNNKFLSYVELRQEWKLSKYLHFFPEERYIYDLYRERYNIIKNKLYESYINLNIQKTITMKDIDYPLRPLVYEIHGYYLKTKHKINMAYINEYMQNIPGKKLLFIYNRMF